MSVVLSDHLPLLASAPDGIQKLRDLVLRLAIEGRITDSDTSNWTQTTLGDVGDWGSGGTPLKAHTDYYGGTIPWLVIGDLNDGLVTAAETHITEKGLANSSAKLVPAGTLLIAMYGSIGKLGIAGIECATNQAIAHCKVNSAIAECRFLFYFVRAIRGQLLSAGQGLAQQNISQKLLKATPIQLPPLAEQHRIVAKVDELMALCDRLEAEQADALSAHARLVETLLGTLTQSIDAADLAANWQRLAEHFDTLFTTEASVDALKQTVLQLAVTGKLVPQDSDDEPASALLARISNQKAKKKTNQLVSLPKNSLPLGWISATLDDFALEVSTGPFGSALHQSDYIENGIPLVNPSHMINDRIVPDARISVPDEIAERLSSYRLSAGDIVMARRGEVGRAALVTEDQTGWLCGTGSFFLRFSAEVDRQYFLLVLRSSGMRTYLAGEAVGTTMVNLNHGILKKAPLAIPPLAEQQRIVDKVDELMELCDNLKSDLATARQRQATLADTLIDSALEAA